jgi:DNA-binding Xre family transcriptional regulator
MDHGIPVRGAGRHRHTKTMKPTDSQLPRKLTVISDPSLRVIQQMDAERQRRGWTMTFLAQQCGIPIEALSVFFSGKREPRLSMLETVAAGLNCDLAVIRKRARPGRPVGTTKNRK